MNAHARPTACFGMESKSGACMSGALHYCVGLHAFAHVGMHLCKGGVLACCVHRITDAYVAATRVVSDFRDMGLAI